jgi:hypothetical protein
MNILIVCAITLIAISGVIIFISKSFEKHTNSNIDKIISKLATQAARLTYIAENDKNPLKSSLYCNYAIGYLLALKDIKNPEEIKKRIGLDISDFESKVTSIQNTCINKMIKPSN